MGEVAGVNPEVLDAVRCFRARTGIAMVVLFGSQARGEAGAHSDVDLLLVDPRFRGKKFFERPVDLYDHWPAEFPADFLCYTPEEFEALKARPTIVRQALDEGTAVA